MAKEKTLSPSELADQEVAAALKAQADVKAAREKAEADDLIAMRHIRKVQDEAAAATRIANLAAKDPSVAALLAERDALLAEKADFEARVAALEAVNASWLKKALAADEAAAKSAS
jgi:hypothetical protein